MLISHSNGKSMSLEARSKVESKEGTNPFGELQYVEDGGEQFAGSKVFCFKDEKGETIRYAVRRGEDGTLSGSEFTVREFKQQTSSGDGYWKNSTSSTSALGRDNGIKLTTGPVYQLHEDKLALLEEIAKERGISM